MRTRLGGVSILEHEAQLSIIAIVNVNVGECILVGGLLRTDDVLYILTIALPCKRISESSIVNSSDLEYFLKYTFGTL